MKPSEKAILDVLRKSTLSHLSAVEFDGIEKAVERDGILNLTGLTASVVKDAVEKAKSVKQGDMVSWNSSGGTASGKVVRVVANGKINVPDSSFEINAEEGDPAVLIQLYRDGKPTDTKVGHKMSTLKKKQQYLNTVATIKNRMALGRTESTTQTIQRAKIPLSQRTQRIQESYIRTMMIPRASSKNQMPMTHAGWMTWTSCDHPESPQVKDTKIK